MTILKRTFAFATLLFGFISLQSFVLYVPIYDALTRCPIKNAQVLAICATDSTTEFMGFQNQVVINKGKGAYLNMPDEPASYILEVSFNADLYGNGSKVKYQSQTFEYVVADSVKAGDEVTLEPVFLKYKRN